MSGQKITGRMIQDYPISREKFLNRKLSVIYFYHKERPKMKVESESRIKNAMTKFTYMVVPEAQLKQMISMEEGWAKKSENPYYRQEEAMVCDGPDEVGKPPFPQMSYVSDPTEKYRCRWAYTTSELEKGKVYNLVIFPKTCSVGFAFVKPERSEKE